MLCARVPRRARPRSRHTAVTPRSLTKHRPLRLADFLLGGEPASFCLDQPGAADERRAATPGPRPASPAARRPSPRASLEASLDARITAAAAAAGGGEWADGNDGSEEDQGAEDDGCGHSPSVDAAHSKRRELAEQIEHMDFAVDKWEQQEIAWSSKLRHHAHSLSQLRRHMQESAQQRAENLGGAGGLAGARARRAVGETFAGGRGTRYRAPLKGRALDGGEPGGSVGRGSAAGTQLSFDSDDLVSDLEMQTLSLPGGQGHQRSVEWDPVRGSPSPLGVHAYRNNNALVGDDVRTACAVCTHTCGGKRWQTVCACMCRYGARQISTLLPRRCPPLRSVGTRHWSATAMRASALRLPLRNPSFQLARHLGREERGEAVWAGKAPQVPSAGGAPCLRRMGTSRRGKMEVTMKRIEMMMRGLGAGSGAPHRHCDCLRPRLQRAQEERRERGGMKVLGGVRGWTALCR